MTIENADAATGAGTSRAPVDHAPEQVQRACRAMEGVYDTALNRRQATMAVLPMPAMARAAIESIEDIPRIPNYDPAGAREAVYRDREAAHIDPEEFYVPTGGEITPALLPAARTAAVWVAEDQEGGAPFIAHEMVDVDVDAVSMMVNMTPDVAEAFHLAGLAAVSEARRLASRTPNG